MKEHGITTSEASFWIHLWPCEKMVYWYSVVRMRRCVSSMFLTYGYSRDPFHTPTGRGYIVAKNKVFIESAEVPSHFLKDVDWENISNRESGLIHGEPIIRLLLKTGIVRLVNGEIREIVSTQSRKNQFKSIDGFVSLADGRRYAYEGKTETAFVYRYNKRVVSPNLFVQRYEQNHFPNYTRKGVERITRLRPLR